jgi:carboxylesterase type B
MSNGARGEPPFRAAIAEYPWWQPLLNETSQEIQLSNVLNLAKCDDLSCLRSMSSEQLAAVNSESFVTGYLDPGYGYGDWYYGPVVDGSFIPELPSEAFNAGRFYDVPLIVDHDAYEGVMFTNASVTTQTEETTDAQVLFPAAGPSFFEELYELYPASDFNSTFYQRQTWFGDSFVCCTSYYSLNQVRLNTWHLPQ